MKDYSQNGESTILNSIFKKIEPKNKFMVEFGASDGFWLSNIRMFIEIGWTGLQLEGSEQKIKNGVKNEFITKENINELFEKYNVPKSFDILSIDIDGNDYWVWESLDYEPSVVVIEYNSNFGIDESYALKYNPSHDFNKNNKSYSASLIALKKLGDKKGYFLSHEVNFMNLIFIKNDYKDLFEELDINKIKLPHHQHNGKNLSDFIEI